LSFQRYRELGQDDFYQLNDVGKASSLTQEQEEQLGCYLDDHLCQNSAEVTAYIKKTFRVEYRPSGVKKLLHRIGFSYHQPKNVPGKYDESKQKAFIKYYHWLRSMSEKDAVFLFGDATHPTHNSIPTYGWIRKGHEKELKANCGRQRVSINGLVDIDTKNTITDFTNSVNAPSVLRLLQKILKCYRQKTIPLFVDNAA
jgi:transposase